jgi:UDPglucose 6-dehydrogenase
LTKISVNSFITMKISFTNQLRLIAETLPKADIHTILDAIGSDSRIGKKYLRAGLSFGGPCFPRDNRLLAYTAARLGLTAPLAEATDKVNEATKQSLLETVNRLTKPGDTVAVLGLAYKPDTWIVEESAGLHLAQHLQRHGRKVLVHDYAAAPSNSPSLYEFQVLGNPESLKDHAEVKVAVLCCPWPQYSSLEVHPNTKLLAFWKV